MSQKKSINSLKKKLLNSFNSNTSNNSSTQVPCVQKQITKFTFEKPDPQKLKKQLLTLQKQDQTEEIKLKIQDIKRQIRNTWHIQDKKNYADSKADSGFQPQNQNDKLYQMAKEATENLQKVNQENNNKLE